VPEVSDDRLAVQFDARGPGRRKVRLWAICHVGRYTPAVKIFDTRCGVARDITFGHPVRFFLCSIAYVRANECK